jgi:redox-sensitive bicupin YhaK (pirin superfamily)
MTAASGLVHEEFHGREFARRGGMFEMVQLWVNLPAKDKMTPPHYQGILNSQIPTVSLPGDHGTVRVIAGELAAVMTDHIVPPYRALIESYNKAQSVQREGHETKLDRLEVAQAKK